jgi:hypothetical protein
MASIGAMLLLACHHAPPYLPSHPISEMFPRASSPPPSCPGQYRSVLERADGDVFLGCWGHDEATDAVGPAGSPVPPTHITRESNSPNQPCPGCGSFFP